MLSLLFPSFFIVLLFLTNHWNLLLHISDFVFEFDYLFNVVNFSRARLYHFMLFNCANAHSPIQFWTRLFKTDRALSLSSDVEFRNSYVLLCAEDKEGLIVYFIRNSYWLSFIVKIGECKVSSLIERRDISINELMQLSIVLRNVRKSLYLVPYFELHEVRFPNRLR